MPALSYFPIDRDIQIGARCRGWRAEGLPVRCVRSILRLEFRGAQALFGPENRCVRQQARTFPALVRPRGQKIDQRCTRLGGVLKRHFSGQKSIKNQAEFEADFVVILAPFFGRSSSPKPRQNRALSTPPQTGQLTWLESVPTAQIADLRWRVSRSDGLDKLAAR